MSKPIRRPSVEKMQFHKRTRFCDNCGEPIRLHDKYKFVELEKQRITVHRNCKDPEAYDE